jgi:beta-galactosidase
VPSRRRRASRWLLPALLLVASGSLGACALGLSTSQASLKPTLELRQADGGTVGFQSGQPVGQYEVQPRPRLDLDGAWRFQPAPALSQALTLGDRGQTRQGLQAEAGARTQADYDDSRWQRLQVPGTFDPPPGGHLTGGWYRTQYYVPATWLEHSRLAFGSADYVADVWLNGKYLGYHEGGSTPFALDPGSALERGAINTLLVRVARPGLGTRLDIVPWGLTDWWDYGGLTGDVWLEAEPDLSVVRADVVPHLDGADLRVVLQDRGARVADAELQIEVLPAAMTAANLLDPDARSLVAPGRPPLATWTLDVGELGEGAVKRVNTAFLVRQPDLWSPALPALYVLHATVTSGTKVVDQLYESFGLRQVQVAANAPRLLLNGSTAAFHGVALHDEQVRPAAGNAPAGGLASDPPAYLEQLAVEAGGVNADLVRADHTPPNPLLLMLADRLGFVVWEEIPLYHFTPQSFQISMQRGVPQQMLAEMVLRDFDHPSVLFHGFANESQGLSERVAALTTLRDLDRRLDGTRLTGQAAYGYDPTDASSAPLDVAGVTFYYGVFYGGPLDGASVQDALNRLHATYPGKPLMVLEFGRWADSGAEEAAQAQVFEVTYRQLAGVMDTQPDGYVGAAVWWSLNDYWTERPGIEVEHFGLFRPDGSARPVEKAVASAYAASPSLGTPPVRRQVVSGGTAIPIGRSTQPGRLGSLVAFALALPTLVMVVLVVALARPRLAWRG